MPCQLTKANELSKHMQGPQWLSMPTRRVSITGLHPLCTKTDWKCNSSVIGVTMPHWEQN